MFTVVDEYRMCKEIRGLSTDTKPLDCGNGSIFFEMDTKKVYMFDAENSTWRLWE